MKLTLRPYQEEAIEAIEGCIAFGDSNIVLKAETSFGKSITAAGICDKFSDKHIVILVNIEPLIDQIAFFLKELGIDYSILKATRESEFDTHARVQLVMSQTYYARAESLKIKADFLIQDEVHKEYDTDRTNKILNDLEPDVRIGLSATPWNQAGYALKNTEIIETASCEDLTKMGYLSKIDYFIPRWSEKVEYGSVEKSGTDFNLTSLDAIIASPKHLDKLVKAMDSRNAKERKTLVFCSTIEQCDRIESALVKAGYHAASYHSKKSKKENERIMTSFKTNGAFAGTDDSIASRSLFNDTKPITDGEVIKCLISVSKLTTGFSVDDIDLGVVARPTKVKSLWHQIAGRMRRKADILDAWIKHLKDNNEMDYKIAMISSPYNEDAIIKKQLKAKKIKNIDVFEYGTSQEDLKEYKVIIDNVRPNKTHGEVLDLGQCINNHGFPEEPYFPPEYTGLTVVDKKNMQEATTHLRMEHLQATIEGDVPELISRKDYDQKIEEITKNAKKLTNLTTRELSNKLEISNKPSEIIAVTAVLFDKIHSNDKQYDKMGRPARGYVSDKGSPVVNFLNPNSITWIAEPWDTALEQEEPFYRRKYIKALRTRSKNLLLKKGNIFGLKFFIEFLLKEDALEKEIAAAGSSSGEAETSYQIEYEGIDIQDEDIPF